LLYHLGGIDFRDNAITTTFDSKYLNYEINCNKFANEFLVPRKIFKMQKLYVSEEKISDLANLFSVSREVILRNYLELGLVDKKYYQEMSRKWIDDAKKSKEESTGGQYYYTQKTYLGETYVKLAFEKYYQEKITIENLSDYLNIKVKNISTFEHYALG
jgi:Zn-dependent peptidase ImmA (M78 family)